MNEFEELYEREYNRVRDDGQMAQLGSFFVPVDDVEVVDASPNLLTTKPSYPEPTPEGLSEVVSSALQLIKRPWIIGKFRYASLRAPAAPPEVATHDVGVFQYEIDPGFPEKRQKIPGVSKKRGIHVPIDARAALPKYLARSPAGASLFRIYPIFKEELAAVDDRVHQEPGGEPKSLLTLSVRLRALSFNFDSREPYGVTAALYDLSTGVKLSEDVYMSVNDEASLRRVRDGAAGETLCDRAIFKVGERRSSVVLVARVSKILRGDSMDSVLEPYLRHESLNQKAMDKHYADLQESLTRLGEFLQPLGFLAVELFTSQGRLRPGLSEPQSLFAPPKASFDSEYLVTKLIPSLLEGSERKLRLIPGVISFDIESITVGEEPPVGMLSPSFVPYKPELKFEDQPLCRLAQGFVKDSFQVVPQYDYVNNLYVTIQSVNLTKLPSKSRNIQIDVRLKDSDEDPLAPGLPLVYGRLFEGKFLTAGNSHVHYHNKKPSFLDEIKIQLPANLSTKHHLVFIFSHITCKEKKRAAKTSAEEPVAFAFLPLLDSKGAFPSETDFELPVSSSFPPNYLQEETDDNELLKWIDKRPVFNLSLRLVSSILCESEPLHTFLSHGRSGADRNMQPLNQVADPALIFHLPRIIDQLFYVIATRNGSAANLAVRQLVSVMKRVEKATSFSQARHPFFSSYVDYKLTLPRGPADGILNIILGVNAMLADEENAVDIARFSWFFFDASVKWIILSGKKDRTEMHRGIKLMIARFLKTLISLSEDQISLAKEVNRSISFFLHDLLSVMDRGQVFSLIGLYIGKLRVKGSPRVSALLAGFKFEALAIICNHEHFVALNLPTLLIKLPKVSTLVPDFAKRHFLIGLLLKAIFTHQVDVEKHVRLSAQFTLRNLLLRHESDARLTPELRKSVISMYFPYCVMFIKLRETFWHLYSLEERRVSLLNFIYILKGSGKELMHHWWNNESIKLRVQLWHALCRALLTFEYKGREHIKTVSVDFTATKMSRVKQLGTYTLRAGRGDEKEIPDKPALGGASSVSLSGSNQQDSPKLRSFARARRATHKNETGVIGRDKDRIPDIDPLILQKEAALSAEVVYTVCDVISGYVTDFHEQLQREDDLVMPHLVDTLVHLLHVNHCAETFDRVTKLIRILVCMFPKPFFVYQTPYVSQLCFRLMILFNALSGAIRISAASLIYVMLRENYQARSNITRMRLAATVGVNRTSDANLKVPLSDERFRKSLRVMLKCTSIDIKSKMPAEFPEEVQALNAKLKSVLKNMFKIRQFSYDPEMVADLYRDNCIQYKSSPDLRATWLSNLAKYHEQQGNRDEAAQCHIHLAALISTYLTLLKPREAVPIDAIAFRAAAPNVASEFVIPQDLAKDEGICQSEMFTREGLFKELEGAVTMLKQGGLYESCIVVERLMAAIHQRNRDWMQLAMGFADLSDLCTRITAEEVESSRLFSLYYRVAFTAKGKIGSTMDPRFKELAGKKYVYKERPEIVISDITNRLVEQYEGAYGAGKVHVLSNKEIKDEDLEDGHLYFQIAALKPYLSKRDLAKRTTDYERQTNLRRFLLETPFSKSGKNQGEWEDQCLRRVIMTVGPGSFPCLRKRLPVVKLEEKVLGPVQNAIGVISSRVAAMRKELDAHSPSTKTVQNVLQGSVLLQVNPGPIRIAEVFLSPETIGSYQAKPLRKLQKVLAQFIGEARKLLLLNASLIGADQIEYQEMLQEGFNDMRVKLSAYVGKEDVGLAVQ